MCMHFRGRQETHEYAFLFQVFGELLRTARESDDIPTD